MRAQGVSEEIRKRHAWLELLQISGPFLTLPVVHRVFPNGLPEVPVQQRATVRALVAQMMDDRGASRHAVIATMLRDVFDWQQHLVIDDAMPQTLTEIVADHGVTLRPDFGYFDETEDDAARTRTPAMRTAPTYRMHPTMRSRRTTKTPKATTPRPAVAARAAGRGSCSAWSPPGGRIR